MTLISDSTIHSIMSNGYSELPLTKDDIVVFWILVGLLSIVVIIILGLFISLMVDFLNSVGIKPTPELVEIIDKFHQGDTSSTSVGMGFGANGTMPIVSSSGSPERFELITRRENEIIRIPCTIEQFYKFNVKDKITVNNYYNRFNRRKLFKTKLIDNG